MSARSAILVMAGLLTLTATSLMAPRVEAQAAGDLVNRISRLEAEIRDLQRHLFAGGDKPLPTVTSTPVQSGSGSAAAGGVDPARTEIRLQQLEAQMRNLTGKVEEVDFNLGQLSERINDLVAGVDRRLAALEAGGSGTAPVGGAAGGQPAGTTSGDTGSSGTADDGARSGVLGYLNQDDMRKLEGARNAEQQSQPPSSGQQSASAPAQPPASDGPVLPEGDAATQYKHAFGYVMRHDYQSAERAFQEFVAAHGEDPLAGNAMYWLGETYYVRGNFADAAVTFAEGYEKYPGSPKTADNLLKLGFSLARLDRKDDACVAFAQLRDEFPNASQTIKRRALDERKRIGCQG